MNRIVLIVVAVNTHRSELVNEAVRMIRRKFRRPYQKIDALLRLGADPPPNFFLFIASKGSNFYSREHRTQGIDSLLHPLRRTYGGVAFQLLHRVELGRQHSTL